MLIKYKGNTSSLLRDLALKLNLPVNMKVSEEVLKAFFQIIFKDLSSERTIEVISILPACIKPFCQKSKETMLRSECLILFSQSKQKATILTIFLVLEKYVPGEKLENIYSLFPEIAPIAIQK